MAGSNNKKNKLRGVTEIVNLNHKRKINESTSWVDLGSGNRPTNSTAQTFGLVDDAGFPILDSDFNQVTAAFGGLGGVESLPSQVTYIGAEGELGSVDPPTYNQLAVAGFAKPLGKYDNFIRKSAARKASQINDQLDASEKVAARANADVLMKARVEEAEKIYNDLYKQYEAEKKAVDAHNENINKKKDALIKESDKLWDKIRAKYYQGQDWGNRAYYAKTDAEMTEEYMKRGGTRIDAQMASLDKQYKDQPSLPDYPDVNDDKYWNDGLNSSTNKVTPSKDPSSLEKLFTSLKAGFWQVSKITQSMLTNKQLHANPTSKQINEFTKTINNTQLSLIPVSQTPIPYSDSNFKEVNEKLVQHHGNSPDYTKNMAWGGEGSEIGDRGSAMLQIVTPKKGEPYILYTDHAYMNTNNPDDATAVQDLGASIVQGISKSKPTGGMDGVYGDVRTEFSVPVSSLSASQQAAVFLNINSRKKRDEKNKLKEGKTFKNFMSSINN